MLIIWHLRVDSKSQIVMKAEDFVGKGDKEGISGLRLLFSQNCGLVVLPDLVPSVFLSSSSFIIHHLKKHQLCPSPTKDSSLGSVGEGRA